MGYVLTDKAVRLQPIENQQNLIVEGCCIPFDWAASFGGNYLRHIQYHCLVMSEAYIRSHFADIKRYANVVEQRLDDSDCTMETLVCDNTQALDICRLYGADYPLIDSDYCVDEAFRI